MVAWLTSASVHLGEPLPNLCGFFQNSFFCLPLFVFAGSVFHGSGASSFGTWKINHIETSVSIEQCSSLYWHIKAKMLGSIQHQFNTLSDPSMYLHTSINTPSYTTSTTNMDHKYVREEEEEENVGRRREEERGVVACRGFWTDDTRLWKKREEIVKLC